MTAESEAIRRALEALHQANLQYMIVGSYAASVHGFTRATHDLDIVVSLRLEDVDELADALGDEFYVDTESLREAITRGDMFNVIHTDSGIKVDFWILGNDEFSRTQFARRQATDFQQTSTWVASAEDTVLSKLLWYRITPSDRQLGDAKGVIGAARTRLDWEYLTKWAGALGVEDLLGRASEA